ncbi:LysR family transcriptional regulator [Actinomadura chibensis]|uniref:LysR family transcriptional regulator n=1 Tax=Actinomadura chibensis TaxID=392828 RepID=A0A5D0NKY7_9ACTN|nr:LysR substrate-binding domain-containing protein [Actinomadura chibensis]TYB44969.1 LysR family transcriptional regulator [Actinomadura chibensis]
MDRLQTRELAYFVAVAEELHFGRAAERLGIAQPPLSRAISRLERRMGVSLLERTSRRVSLTPAGEVFLTESRRALDAVDAAVRRAQRAGRVAPRLVLVMKPGGDCGLLPEILAAYGAAPDAVPVDVVLCSAHERAGMIRDGRADIGLLHRPNTDLTGLDTEELLTEDQVVVLPRDHRLADRAAVSLADLAGETMPSWTTEPRDTHAPGKNRVPVRDVGQLMQLIALGRAVAVVPASVRGHLRDDLTCVPVSDARPTTLVLAWARGHRAPALAAFVRTATTVAAHRYGGLASESGGGEFVR